MTKYCIIAAGGNGSRMGVEMPKQFLLLNEMPILWHSLQSFHSYDPAVKLIVALPEQYFDTWAFMCGNHDITIPHYLVKGGEQRFHSIRNALDTLGPAEGVVAIHDGARPLVSVKLIRNAYEMAEKKGCAIPAIPVSDSLRELRGRKWQYADRTLFKAIQTPQTFELKALWNAYRQAYRKKFTDDASVYEAAGNTVHLINGEPGNFKITTPDDLAFAGFMLQKS